MATPVNEFDKILQAETPRTLASISTALVLSTTANNVFVDGSGNGTPSVINMVATPIGMYGTIVFTTSPSVSFTVDSTGKILTMNQSAMGSSDVTVTATLTTANGLVFSDSKTVKRVTIGTLGYSGALNATVNNTSQGLLANRPAGVNGDFYFATDNLTLYQKLSGVWVAASTIGANAANFTGTLGGDNLMWNSGFELRAQAGSNRPSGYSAYNNAGISTTYVDVAGRTGGKAFGIRADAAGATNWGLYSGNEIIEPDGTVGGVRGGWQANKTYIVSFKAKKVSGSGFSLPSLQWNTAPSSVTWVTRPALTTTWQTYTVRLVWGASVEGGGHIYIDCNSGTVSINDEFHVDELIVQEGDVYSEWFPSAAEAKAAADIANTAIANISSDNILSKGEKPAANQAWTVIYNERAGLQNQAGALGVDSSAYQAKYNALQAYLVSLGSGWTDFTTDTPIVGTTFSAGFSDYYTEKQALLNAIAAKAATLANWSGVSGTGKPADNATVGAADAATALGFNPQFSDWTGTYPAGWTAWTGSAPVKETGTVRTAPYAVKYTVSSNTGAQASYIFATALPAGTFVQGAFDINIITNNGGGGAPGYLIRLYTNAAHTGYTDTVAPVSDKTVTGWQRVPFSARVGTSQQIYGITIFQMAAYSGMPGGLWADGSVCVFDNLTFDFVDSSTDNNVLVPSINSAATTATWGGVTGTGKPSDYATVSGADAATSLGFNPQFSNWTGTYPEGWAAWAGPAPTKETSIVRTSPYAVRYTVSGATGAFAIAGFSTPLPAGSFVQGAYDVNILANNGGGYPGYLIRLFTNSTLTVYTDTVVPVTDKTVTGWQRVPFSARVPAGQQIWGIQIYQMAAWGGMPGNLWADGSVCIFDNLVFDFCDSSIDNNTLVPSINSAATTATWGGVSGTGKPADNASADVALVSAGSVTIFGNSAVKTGSSGWTEQVYSRDSFTGGAYASIVAADTTGTISFGLNSASDLTDASYDSLDYSIVLDATMPAVKVYESGFQVYISSGSWAVNDVFAVVYDGTNVKYLKNGTVFYTSSATIAPNQRLFFDSSLWSPGATLKNIRFGPMSSNNWANVGGSGKPADNATVGAPSGTNVGSTPATTVESNAANGQSAYNAVNDGTTGLAQRLRANAANILSGSGGLAAGTLTWDSSGNRTGGYGVGINQRGIVAYNSSGVATFTLDGSTGNATFYGALSGATGTFAGSLSAATGTFAGTLTASQIVTTSNLANNAATDTALVSSSPVTVGRVGSGTTLDNSMFTTLVTYTFTPAVSGDVLVNYLVDIDFYSGGGTVTYFEVPLCRVDIGSYSSSDNSEPNSRTGSDYVANATANFVVRKKLSVTAGVSTTVTLRAVGRSQSSYTYTAKNISMLLEIIKK